MSIGNRYVKGTVQVKRENKITQLLGKVYCLFAGHKPVYFVDQPNDKFCICCWKELNKKSL